MSNFSRYVPDYGLALKKSIELIEDVKISSVPIFMQAIVREYSRSIHLTSYEEFSKETGMTIENIINAFKSEDGACIYERETERYIIFYNEEKPIERLRFTVAHELGHIFLEHHIIAGNDILSRSYLTNKEYELFEKEANCFARNLLAPAPLSKIIKDADESGLYVTDHFQEEFNIGIQASKFRLGFLQWDLNKTTEEINNFIKETFPEYKKCCRSCRIELTNECLYCINCGTRQPVNNTSFQYKSIAKDSTHCNKCGHTTPHTGANFCIICGNCFSNFCTNTDCGVKNLSTASYCNKCGSKTNLYELNKNLQYDGVNQKMEYNDGVEFDKETCRVLKCPKCENEEFSDAADFCRICGTNLYNLCLGDAQENQWGDQYRENQHKNPSNARYCETCGKETIYFTSDILNDYMSYQQIAKEYEELPW